MIIIDDNLLFRHFSGEATDEERAAIGKWVTEDERNRKRYRNASELYERWLMAVPLDTIAEKPVGKNKGRGLIRKVLLAVADVAAVAVICAVASWAIERRSEKTLAETMTVVEVPAGNRMDIVLSDGTKVRLNSGSRLSYPLRFAKDRRNVTLTGEACFEVAHNPSSPFTVSTFASDVQVVGTEFDVMAYEECNMFRVALLNGAVKVSNTLSPGQEILMRPGETVALRGNMLSKEEGGDVGRQMNWLDGILNVEGMDFKTLIRNMERAYGVRIKVERKTMPELRYTQGELRISDGIDYAFRTLQNVADFSYEIDYHTGVVTIR